MAELKRAKPKNAYLKTRRNSLREKILVTVDKNLEKNIVLALEKSAPEKGGKFEPRLGSFNYLIRK